MTEKEMLEKGILKENIESIKNIMNGSCIPLLLENEDEIVLMIKDVKEKLIFPEASEIKFGINQYLINTGFSETAIIILAINIDEYKTFTFFFGSNPDQRMILNQFLKAKNVTFTLNHVNENNELEVSFINIQKNEIQLPFKILEHMKDDVETISYVKDKILLGFNRDSIYDLVFDEKFTTNTLLDLAAEEDN